MSLEVLLLILFVLFVESFLLIKLYKQMAQKLKLVDVPNNRSSHVVPTPLGAGIVFLACISPAVGAVFYLEGIGTKPFYVLLIGSLVYTILGFVDDVKALSAVKRLVPQIMVALWVLLELTSYLSVPFEVAFLPFDSQILALVFGVLFLCWMVNLFNFMDGLDGLLGGQAFVLGILSAGLSRFQGESSLGVLYLMISVTVLPFLYFNWRPAKIFMGDAGAYFLGFFFAVLGLVGKIEFSLSLVAQVTLMGALICDSTLTLFFRLLKTGKVFQAHKTHGFQVLRHVKKWRTSRVALAYAFITLIWFFPLSVATIVWPKYAVLICFFSYAPVLLVLNHLGVGRESKLT